MDTPPPFDPPPSDVPPEPPILLPASDLPPFDEPTTERPVVLQPAVRPVPWRTIAWAGAGTVLVVAAFLVFRVEAVLFLVCGIVVPPIVTLPLLAYAGERVPAARAIAFVVWIGLAALGAFQSLSATAEVAPGGNATAWVAVVDGAGFLLAICCFARPVRALAANWLPIDPRSFVHAIAVASVVAATVMCVAPLVVLGNPPALDDATSAKLEQLQQVPGDLILRLTAYIYFWVIASLVCFVGFPIARSLRAALERMGLVVPSLWQTVGALIGAILLVGVMTGVDYGIGWLWSAFGWPQTDAKRFNEMMKYAINPAGAVIIGVSAGLSEELLFRGVLQPRLGLFVSNLCFAALHALQYNFDALLSVFLIGLLLGVIRRRTNTTTSAIVHGTYDFLSILLTFLQVPGFS